VMVQGDTTTTFAASLSAQYHKVRVGHVEAGLRTGNKSNPFPEEINRCLVGAVSDWHFAPTEDARNNLLREGVSSSQICVTGNTSIDAIQMVTDRPFTFSDPVLSRMNGRIVLITAHRRESFGEPLQSICHAIRKLAGLFPHDSFVYPVHLNPEVHGPVYSLLGDLSNVILTDPLKYLPFAHLMKRSHLILTDSGGIQEEAPALNKPVLVMRDMTERMEAIEAGAARLVGTKSETIVEETVYLLTHPKAYEEMAYAPNPYGDGNAAEQIASFLFSHLFKPARA
jgi:UDP-N-acetylglucosamine 2-epimerase